MPPTPRANYGIDAPSVVLVFVVLAAVTLLAALFAAGGMAYAIALVPLISFTGFAGTAYYMIYSSRQGKFRLWNRLLDELDLKGDERVLDIGCGRGAVLIAAARLIPRGRAAGIDVWRSKDQSGNDRSVTLSNADLEGVGDRVEVDDGDMRDLPYADNLFDLVTASLAIHNLAGDDDRSLAVREIARVARPGGRVLIVDIAGSALYERTLHCEGWSDVSRSGLSWNTYPPSRIIRATKPG